MSAVRSLLVQFFVAGTVFAFGASKAAAQTPGISELVARSRQFVDGWSSVSGRSVTMQESSADAGGWEPASCSVHRFERTGRSEVHSEHRSLTYATKRWPAQVNVGETVLDKGSLIRVLRSPSVLPLDVSVEHLEDISWMENVRISVTYHDGRAANQRAVSTASGIPFEESLLQLDASTPNTVLDLIESQPNKASMVSENCLGRSCWRIGIADKQYGRFSLVVCPELGGAIMEIKRTLSAQNQLMGKRLSEHAVLSQVRTYRVTSFDEAWNSFEVESQTETKRSKSVTSRRTLTKFYDLVRPVESLDGLWWVPPEGQKVVFMNNQQIECEWRNGEVVRVYDDKVIEKLDEIRMSDQPVISKQKLLFGSGCIALVALFLWKRLGKRA